MRDQLTLFGVPDTEPTVVNVASVPHRSPFRYPGGKTWLVPRARQWLKSRPSRPAVLVEPFGGGAIIGLTAVFEELVDRLLLVELDENVAAVWKTVLSGGANALAERILEFDVTHENVKEVLGQRYECISDRAFQTILRNRMQHGGIMARGASLIKNGENGKGLRSRWYASTLARRLRDIDRIRDRITFVAGDGLEVVRQHIGRTDAVFFIDPPYTVGGSSGKRAGTRLYAHFELDHRELFKLASQAKGDVLLTYDDAPDVRQLAVEQSLTFKPIAMKNTHHAKMTELLIGKNLAWLD
ncbi:MAG: DNA methyltransferase [Chloroflexota bacterium]|nr:MAG: DNA methyltransferase [Chloroflexota bacterium]